MTATEIKKECYKQKPMAELEMVRGGNIYYSAILDMENETPSDFEISFVVPISDIGTTDFYPTMDAKLLLRWLDIN